ncbi:GspMb/PilO family protein [Aeromonas veronii]
MSLQLQWRQLVAESKEQWDTNSRVRYGTMVIGLISLLWLNLVMSDLRTDLQSHEASALNQLAEYQQSSGNESWPERLEQVRKELDSTSLHFGRAQSEALARADLQSRIAALLKENGLAQGQIEVSSAPSADAVMALTPLQLRINGRAKALGLLKVINQLERTDPVLRVENLTISNQVGDELIYNLIATVWFHPFGATP